MSLANPMGSTGNVINAFRSDHLVTIATTNRTDMLLIHLWSPECGYRAMLDQSATAGDH